MALLCVSTLTAARAEADQEAVSALIADPVAVCAEQACGGWVLLESGNRRETVSEGSSTFWVGQAVTGPALSLPTMR